MFQQISDYLQNIPFLTDRYFQNSLADYLIASIVFLTTSIGVIVIRHVLINWLSRFVNDTKNKFDNLVLSLLLVINFPFYFVLSLFISSRYLTLSTFVDTNLTRVVFLVGYIYLCLGLQKALSSILDALTQEEGEELPEGQKKMDPGTADFLKRFLGGLIWLAAILLVIQNLGYDISTLIGGLGIAGIAVAFALQNVLSDIFAYFTINLDKPFKKGDFIIVGNDMGTVKNIGLKNTRIQTLQGQDLVVTNRELTDSRINNYASMSRRRVSAEISVTLETPKDDLEKIPTILEELIRMQMEATFDRAHLKEIGEYCFKFEYVYHLETPSYDTYMDVNQIILLEIIRRFKTEGIKLSYPTNRVFFNEAKR